MTKILVIEDEEAVRLNLVEMLEAEDYDVVSAQNGMMGVMWALDYIPDLIISDVMMPELDGYGVLNTLRQDSATATIPFIFLTAKADKGDIREGMELGADDYLTKPFSRDELLQSITVRLKKHLTMMQQPQHASGSPQLQQENPSDELQQKLQELQQSAGIHKELLKKSHQEMSNFLAKINMAVYMLQNTTSEAQRDRCLEILQEACTEEIELLNQIPKLQELLTPENVKLLHQLNLGNSRNLLS